jgi:hypothetical protein
LSELHSITIFHENNTIFLDDGDLNISAVIFTQIILK